MMTRNRKFIKRKIYRKIKKNSANLNESKHAIVNLSNKVLNTNHIALLSKGLNFSPTRESQNEIEQLRDVLLFSRRIRLKHHYENKNKDNDETTPNVEYTPNPFKLSSGWTPPPGRNKDLDSFINCIVEDICQEPQKRKKYSNLSRNELVALRELKNDEDIIIKPADKGGAIVLMNRADYINEANRQLNNQMFYEQVRSNQNEKISKKIKEFVNSVKHLLPVNLAQYLLQKHWRTPIFYTLPKIHKPGNPGRPIISQIESPTAKMSKVVDVYLKPFILKIPSYLKDTTDFLQKLKALNKVPPQSILVTADVTSLYTNIPHREGILASKEMLDKRENKNPPTWILLRFIHFILTENCFKFNDKYYMQKMGTSMGTIMAPEYAIIFMDKIEREFLNTQHKKPLVWWRFIDDIFIIWPHSSEELKSFTTALNDYHHTIKFTFTINKRSVNFLDTIVNLDDNGNLTTTLYKKPTDANLYLHYSSHHPKHQKDSIPYSQALRIRRICSKKEEFTAHAENLQRNFIVRGYPPNLVNQAIEKARQKNRTTLLEPVEKNTDPNIPLVTSFSNRTKNINRILNHRKDILTRTPDTQNLAQTKFVTTYRRSTTLRSILVHTDITNKNKIPGTRPCGKKCYLCRFMKPTNSIKSASNQYTIKIRDEITCETINVVYVIECTKCKKQYVGQTGNSLKERFRGHFNDINVQNQHKPVSQHFTSEHHSRDNVTIKGIVITKNDVNIRLRTEESLIHKLGTAEPWGLNRRR